MLLFGTSTMLPHADAAMRPRLRRLRMQAVVSAAIVAASLFLILTHGFDPGKGWAYGSVGMVFGFWLNSK